MLTVRHFVETWLTHRENSGRYKRPTLVQERYLIGRHLLPALGDLKITDVTLSDVNMLLARLSDEVNERTGRPKAHTARRLAVVLKKLLKDAAADHLLKDNLAQHVKLPAVPVEEARTFSLDEIERLLGAVRDDYKPFTLVAMLTGARFGEIRELRWKDIDFARGWIQIRRQRPTHEGDTVRFPKWDSIRTVEMMDPVRQVLRTLPRGNADALVFPTKAGRPVHPSHFRRHVWNPALFKSGTRMKPHEMRDVFVSLMIAFGEDIMRIASQTGHRNLAVFFHHYAHEFQRNGRRLSRKETYRRLMAAFRIRADPERANFLSVNQAANALGVSWGWLFELIRKEKIPATKRGQWLIPRDALTQIRLPRSRRRDEHPQTPKKR